MDETTLKKMEEINDIKEFVEFLGLYYPGMSINNYTIEEIERALFHTYIKIIGRVMYYSPLNMRTFLKNYLMKYEIMNIQRLILGTVLGMSSSEKALLVNKLVERYLGNIEFINDLVKISSLDEIQVFMKKTKFNEAVREGILYFKKTNEIFVLEAFLGRLYYENLQNELKFLSQKETVMISLYVKYISEIYNLNIIYRGIKNNIDKNLLTQFLVDNYLFLNEEILSDLLNLGNADDFITLLTNYLRSTKELKFHLQRNPIKRKHLIWEIEKLYLTYFFKRFEIKIDDIEYQAVFKIMEVLIKKDKEIRLDVLPKVVKILHEKYRVLK